MTPKNNKNSNDNVFSKILLLTGELQEALNYQPELVAENCRVRTPGVSVIIPVYRARDTLERTLQSLKNQTLDKSLFEVILIFNGPDDGSINIARSFVDANFNVRIFSNEETGAGAARNKGLSLSRRSYITFVDADDFLGSKFLEEALSKASPDLIVLSPIYNTDSSGELDRETVLAVRTKKLENQVVLATEIPWAFGFNACKLVPASLIKNLRYDTSLRSGEDLVMFANLFVNQGLKVKITSVSDDTAYIRQITEDSVSRQADSYQFNVLQRIECMKKLGEIRPAPASATAVRQLQLSQASFIQRYIQEHPEAGDKLELDLTTLGYLDFPWSYVNRGRAQDLVISYCFPPFSDTSASIASKAIAERRRIVDVISNDISSIRYRDRTLNVLSSRWIEKHVELKSSPSFSGWVPISDFAEKALDQAEKWVENQGEYRTLYSRALWVGSHVAALLYKDRHRGVVWSAEFSDPIRHGVNGERRTGNLVDNTVARTLFRIIEPTDFSGLSIETLFDLVELATFILADELIFTNSSQREYMLRGYPETLQEEVISKSRIRPHPTPSEASYNAVVSTFEPIAGRVNIGYFGAFYVNRGMDEVYVAVQNLPSDMRKNAAVHIFCNNVEQARSTVQQLGIDDVVHVRSYLPYIEFLNALQKFDCLLVNDIVRGPDFDINPFLPSKLSDYRGSGTKIWGLVDEGSPLSKFHLDFRSPVGNQSEALKTLKRILVECDPA